MPEIKEKNNKQSNAALKVAEVKTSKPAPAPAKPVVEHHEKKVKQPNRFQRWWRETIGELRKVSWPTTHDAWRLTRIVIYMMLFMSALLGLLDFVFSKFITLILA